jgi:hypothetical protein
MKSKHWKQPRLPKVGIVITAYGGILITDS